MNHFEEIRNFPEHIKIKNLASDEGTCTIWGEEVTVTIESDDEKKALPEETLSFLEKYLAWIDHRRQDALQCLFDDGILELAEDWASSAEPYYGENEDDDDDEDDDKEPECYIMEDGQKVFLPVTEQDFSKSLHLTNITFNCSDEEEDFLTELWCDCLPDYFACHSILIYLNPDGSFENGSLQG